MAQALALAALAASQTHPNPSVGCVIVAPSKLLASGEGPPRQAAESAAADASTASPVVVGQGFHPYAGAPHAEVFALRAAGRRARGATAYVTLEPCAHHGRTPPCASALIEAGVERVVVGVLDPDPRVSGKGVAMLQRAGIEVELGCMKEQATSINREFFERVRKERAAQ